MFPVGSVPILYNDSQLQVIYGYWSSVTSPVSDCNVSHRPFFSLERVPYRKNNKVIATKENIRIKSDYGPEWEPDSETNWATVSRKKNSTKLKTEDPVWRRVRIPPP
jgi:hypothetical protein